jgi:hypothetical protein
MRRSCSSPNLPIPVYGASTGTDRQLTSSSAVVPVTGRSDRVNARADGVKVASCPAADHPRGGTLAASGRHRGGLTWRGHGLMADLAFAVLLIAGFLVLALTLRGLEKL